MKNRRDSGPAGRDDVKSAEYVLGVLADDEREAIEHNLTHDASLQAQVAFWQDNFQQLADAVPPMTPGDNVFTAIEAAIEGKPQPGSITIRSGEGDWEKLFDGVFKKKLLVDENEGAESFLLRIEPNASCPAHSHTRTEECLVLEGEMIIGEARFKAGDYHAAPPDVPHLPITSQTGALLYVRSELHA